MPTSKSSRTKISDKDKREIEREYNLRITDNNGVYAHSAGATYAFLKEQVIFPSRVISQYIRNNKKAPNVVVRSMKELNGRPFLIALKDIPHGQELILKKT